MASNAFLCFVDYYIEFKVSKRVIASTMAGRCSISIMSLMIYLWLLLVSHTVFLYVLGG